VVEEALAAAAATTMLGCTVHAYQGWLLSWRHERLLHASVWGAAEPLQPPARTGGGPGR
jgi:hypothetical protein